MNGVNSTELDTSHFPIGSQTNNGQTDSSAEQTICNIDNRAKQLDDTLDDFEKKSGIRPEFNITDETKNLLNLSDIQLKGMNAEECGIAAYQLERYSLHIQRLANRQQSKLTWAEASIRKIIAPLLGQQKAYSFDERKLLAIRENDAAQKLEKIKVDAQVKLERISYISSKIGAIAKTLIELQQSKRGKQ